MKRGRRESSIKNRIKILLENGHKISVLTALKLAGTTELRHYISKLKREGLCIHSKWIEFEGKRFKEHELTPNEELKGACNQYLHTSRTKSALKTSEKDL